MFQPRHTLLVAAAVIGLGGCTLSRNEDCCPTDARRLVYSCAGQEAVRQGPCGPNEAYYGHHPTCWSAWPDGWRQYEADHCSHEGSCDGGCEGGCEIQSPTRAAAEHEVMGVEPYAEVIGRGPEITPIPEIAPAEEALPPRAPEPLPSAEPVFNVESAPVNEPIFSFDPAPSIGLPPKVQPEPNAEPAEPVRAVAPARTTAPAPPVEPESPVEAELPVEPVTPVEPVPSVEPVSPPTDASKSSAIDLFVPGPTLRPSQANRQAGERYLKPKSEPRPTRTDLFSAPALETARDSSPSIFDAPL